MWTKDGHWDVEKEGLEKIIESGIIPRKGDFVKFDKTDTHKQVQAVFIDYTNNSIDVMLGE